MCDGAGFSFPFYIACFNCLRPYDYYSSNILHFISSLGLCVWTGLNLLPEAISYCKESLEHTFVWILSVKLNMNVLM